MLLLLIDGDGGCGTLFVGSGVILPVVASHRYTTLCSATANTSDALDQSMRLR